jgi:hypothetical protein
MSDGGAQFQHLFLGSAYAGFTIDFYAAGTSTGKNAWLDETKASATQQVSADSNGMATWYADGDYRLRIKDANGNLLWDWPSYKMTSDTATMWEGNFGTAYPTAVSKNQWQKFALTDGSDNLIELGINQGSQFIPYTNFVNVKWFGAKGDGATDDTTAIQAASDSLTSGGVVFFPRATYLHNSALTISNNDVIFVGEGWGTKLKAGATMAQQIEVTGVRIKICELQLDGNGNATNGISVNATAANNDQRFDRLYIASQTTSGIKNTLGDAIHISGCFFNTCGTALWSVEDARNSIFEGNYVIGANGCLIQKTTQGAEGVRILNNTILPNTSGLYGIKIEGALQIDISHNVIDQCNAEAIKLDGSSKSINNIQISNNWLGGASGVTNLDGINLTGSNISDVFIINNTTNTWSRYHCTIGANIDNVSLAFNSMNDTGTENLRLVGPNEQIRLIDNRFANSTLSVNEQATTVKSIAMGNFMGSTPTISDNSLWYKNPGFITEAIGTGTITSGNTDVTITHGLDYTPKDRDVTITGLVLSTNNVGDVIVDALTATTFDVTVRNDPGASGFNFAWHAKRRVNFS